MLLQKLNAKICMGRGQFWSPIIGIITLLFILPTLPTLSQELSATNTAVIDVHIVNIVI